MQKIELSKFNAVPCNGCKLCCMGDAVRLLPTDDPDLYKTEPHPVLKGSLMLAHQQNGECIYLNHSGCSIQETKPQMCKEMDCRNIASAITFTQARKLSKRGLFKMQVFEKGKELLKATKNR